jgi:uncharacterized protein (TIGR02996 family)
VSTVGDLLAAANGKRRNNLLTVADVDAAIDEARTSPTGIAVRHGGAQLLGKTTLCLAVKDGRSVVVGIDWCWADKPTPGRVWKELGPWQADYTRNLEKVAKWVKKKGKDRVRVTPSGAAKTKAKSAPKGDGRALLAAVLADPDDDGPRLVYADWLTAQGDPRGEFITVQCALAKDPKNKALRAREKALMRKASAWTKAARQIGRECVLRRGFVSSVRATALAFISQGASLFATEPVEELEIAHGSPGALERLAAAPHLAKLRSLDVRVYVGSDKDLDKVKKFLRAPAIAQLRQLKLSIGIWQQLDASSLLDGISWPKLEALQLLTFGSGLDGLATAKLPSLKTLILPGKQKAVLAKFGAVFTKAKVATKPSTTR